ncbi:MAG TPA: ABC transporter permease [Chloroflexi bacterium]|nr:ABC transporter permease [Chloroflexota bacterium]
MVKEATFGPIRIDLQQSRALRQVIGIVTHPAGRIGTLLVIPILFLAVFGPSMVPWGPNALNTNDLLQAPSTSHLMGTDQLGRDQFARVIDALPLAFTVPFGAVGIALVAGSIIGVLAGYLGAYWERFLMWITDIFLAMPALLLAIFVVAVFGGGAVNTMIAISLIYMPRFARIARGSTLRIKNLAFTDAARIAGVPPLQIIARHILPSIFPELLVMATLSLSNALVALSTLSFLGLGVIPPQADLGNMLSKSVKFVTLAPWLIWFPALVLTMIILSFNLTGDAVRDVVDPRVNRAREAASRV